MFEYGGRPSYDDNNNYNPGNNNDGYVRSEPDSGSGGGGGGSYDSYDSSSVDYSYSGSTDDGGGVNEAEARAASEEAKKAGEAQLKLLQEIADNVKSLETTTVAMSDKLSGQLQENKQATNAVESAVRSVEMAVNGTNQSGRLDAILGAISNLG